MADMCATAIAEACHVSNSLRLLRFDEAELPVQVLRGRHPEPMVELRSPDVEAMRRVKGGRQRSASMVSGTQDGAGSGSVRSFLDGDEGGANFGSDTESVGGASTQGGYTGSVVSGGAPSTARTGRKRMRNAVRFLVPSIGWWIVRVSIPHLCVCL